MENSEQSLVGFAKAETWTLTINSVLDGINTHIAQFLATNGWDQEAPADQISKPVTVDD